MLATDSNSASTLDDESLTGDITVTLGEKPWSSLCLQGRHEATTLVPWDTHAPSAPSAQLAAPRAAQAPQADLSDAKLTRPRGATDSEFT